MLRVKLAGGMRGKECAKWLRERKAWKNPHPLVTRIRFRNCGTVVEETRDMDAWEQSVNEMREADA